MRSLGTLTGITVSLTANRAPVIAIAIGAITLAACSSDDDSSSTTSPPAGSSAAVDQAIAGFPDGLLARFAIANNDVTAGEIYRRVEFADGVAGTPGWGVEGMSADESLELETFYDADGTVVEAARTDVIDTLPVAVSDALLATYPDARIDEIERTDVDGNLHYAVLISSGGQEEIEPNYDASGTLLFTEEVFERDVFPANVLAASDASGVTGLPIIEYERLTFADGALRYAIEYENEAGQSLTITFAPDGTTLRTEHEDNLARLSMSDTVAEALAEFPASIEADFSAGTTEVTATEIFRSEDRTVTPATFDYGIEGLSADESLEISATYDLNGMRLDEERGSVIDALPAPVSTAFDQRHPGVTVEEIVQTEADGEIEYAVLFIDGEDEAESNFDAQGAFLSNEQVAAVENIPAAVLDAVGAEIVLLPILEIESVTMADGTVEYVAEYENLTGDSISYRLMADGTFLSVDHEAAITDGNAG